MLTLIIFLLVQLRFPFDKKIAKMSRLVTAFVCTVMGTLSILPHGTVSSEEIYALSDLFEATGGASGTWASSAGWEALLEDGMNVTLLNPCADSWYGVTCDTTMAHVTALDLSANAGRGAPH